MNRRGVSGQAVCRRALGSALDGSEILAVVATVRGGSGGGIRAGGGTTTASGLRRGTAGHTRDRLAMAAGDDVERVAGELEE